MGRVTKRNNKINQGNHSMNADRSNKSNQMRSSSTIKRLKMYRGGKAKRNAQGKITKEAAYQTSVGSGTMARIEPNRKWFGNTRVIAEKDYQMFQEFSNKHDSYQVTLKKTVMPISLSATKPEKKKKNLENLKSYINTHRKNNLFKDVNSWAEYRTLLDKEKDEYDESKDTMKSDQLEVDKDEARACIFRAGTSKRVWNQLMNVIDSSDVILYVLDVRDPEGTRNKYIESFLEKEKPNKKLIYVLNKVDLVPLGVTKAWKRYMSQFRPTVAFYADLKHSFGRSTLMSLLRQVYQLQRDCKQISIGVIGYPNVGKSSLINTLRNKKVCKVAPVAGETKVWQYITLMKTMHLIDCPGVVFTKHSSETELILKGAVRVEKVEDADMFIPKVLELVKPEILKNIYKINKDWNNFEEFLELVANKTGRLLKGGYPDVKTVAKKVLSDFQRGFIPYYMSPPDYDRSKETPADFFEVKSSLIEQSKKEEAEMKKIELDMMEEENLKNYEKFIGEDEQRLDVVEEDNEENNDKEGEEEKEEEVKNNDDIQNEFYSGLKEKKKKLQKTVPIKKKEVTKLTSKQRRKMERASKSKKTGVHYYDMVDVKNKNRK